MEKYSLVSIEENSAEKWDDFVINHSHGSVHQIAAWRDFQVQIPGRSIVKGFAVVDKKSSSTSSEPDAEILAVTLCVRMETGMAGKYWWYSARGPVFDPEKNGEAGKFLIEKTAEVLQKIGGMFWRIDPYFRETDWRNLNIKNLKLATQNYQPTDTLMLDLTKSDEDLLTEMKRKGRYNIKLSTKKGVTFHHAFGSKISAEILSKFCKLSHETTSRDGFSGHEESYYQKFLTTLADSAGLFWAESEGTMIAAAISTFVGKKAIYYFGASTSDPNYRNLMAPYGLQWYMIQYAKSRECTSYDFLGIAPENQPNHAYSGISEFKWKFGGARHTYAAGKEIVFESWWYCLYRVLKRIKG